MYKVKSHLSAKVVKIFNKQNFLVNKLIMAIQKTLRRTLTEVERAKIRKHFQTFMPYLSKILNNDKINNETKAIVKKMHKSMKDALDYSNRLNYLK